MNKPLIGVMPLVDYEKDSYWMLPGYMKGIAEAGGLPVMLPITESDGDLRQILGAFDGFLFTGGQDVSPELYKEKKHPQCGETSPERDKMETKLIHMILEEDKPLFGICRGIQILNVALGGTLYQDLPEMKPSDVCHCQTPPYDRGVHRVTIDENTPLYDVVGEKELFVNSYHHQAVKEIAPALCSCAVSQDGLTEGVYMKNKKFVLAVQWHPEFSYRSNEYSLKLLEAFVSAAK